MSKQEWNKVGQLFNFDSSTHCFTILTIFQRAHLPQLCSIHLAILIIKIQNTNTDTNTKTNMKQNVEEICWTIENVILIHGKMHLMNFFSGSLFCPISQLPQANILFHNVVFVVDYGSQVSSLIKGDNVNVMCSVVCQLFVILVKQEDESVAMARLIPYPHLVLESSLVD